MDLNLLVNKNIRFIIIYTMFLSFLYSGHPITIDGLFEDWADVPISYYDANNDHVDADYSVLKITYDSQYLFIYINFHEDEFLIQNWNDFHLFIDADDNLNTGFSVHGIGAELEWCFGERSGFQHLNGQENEIYQNDLKLRVAPTITSNEFEIAIERESLTLNMNNSQQLIQGKIVFSEFGPNENIGDLIPSELGGVPIFIGEDFIPFPQKITLEKIDESDIRIVSYNTLNTGILDIERQSNFKRIFQAIKPDIIALQEHGEWDEIHDVVQAWFPDNQWYSSWTYRDLIILSRFQILNDANFIDSERTMVALLNTENELGENLLIFNSHLSCCDNDESRQEQVDDFTSSWKNWIQNNSGPFELEHGTPFLHLGDFNFVGFSQQVKTIAFGDIFDEAEYGIDFFPDWDGTEIKDLFPRHTNMRMGYTWRNDGSSFNPGKLDYIFYSDESIDTGKYFILNTLTMDQDDLYQNNLDINDTKEASDHLPLVFDISLNNSVGISDDKINPININFISNFPNPFNQTTNIEYHLKKDSFVNIRIFDLKGTNIKLLLNVEQPFGYHRLSWNGASDNGDNLPTGIYFLTIQADDFKAIKKMVLLK